PARGFGDRPCPGRVHRHNASPGGERRARLMWSDLPLFPERASAMAGRVDALYFFLLAVAAFFSLLIAALIVVFFVKYRRRNAGDIGVQIKGSWLLET